MGVNVYDHVCLSSGASVGGGGGGWWLNILIVSVNIFDQNILIVGVNIFDHVCLSSGASVGDGVGGGVVGSPSSFC